MAILNTAGAKASRWKFENSRVAKNSKGPVDGTLS